MRVLVDYSVSRRIRRPFRLIYALIFGLSLALILLAVLAATTSPAHAGTICVKPGGGDGCEQYIQDALDMAQPGDTILVAAGTYTENVLITQTVTLQGGWNDDFTIRDINAFSSTIIPFYNTQSVVSIVGINGNPGAVAPILDGFFITGGRADTGGNHGGGLKIIDSSALVISNTIHNNAAFYLGGGVWVQRGAPVLQGNVIQDNVSDGLGQEAYGGGLELENSQAVLRDNTIAHNIVSGTSSYGGGIDIAGGASALLDGNLFFSNTTTFNNSAGYGGGISVRNGPATISDTAVNENRAGDQGGGIWVSGGNVTGTAAVISGNWATNGSGLYNNAEFDDSAVSLIDSTVARNGEGGLNIGGGIFNHAVQGKGVVNVSGSRIVSNTANVGAGMINFGSVLTKTRLTIADTTISGNMALNFAGIINTNGLLTMTQVSLAANVADDYNGGLYNFSGGIALVSESAICDNVADNDGDGTGDGGGIYNNMAQLTLVDSTVCRNSAATFGGGIFSNGEVTINSTLLSDNSADDGGALFVEDAASSTTIISSTLDQNIAHQSAGAINNSGMLAISASTFSGNTAEMFSAGAILNNGETTLVNVTFSGNTSAGFGGAIRNLDTLTMTNVTIASNSGVAGAGIYNDQDTWLVSTIIAGNTGSNCDGNPLTSLGYNAGRRRYL